MQSTRITQDKGNFLEKWFRLGDLTGSGVIPLAKPAPVETGPRSSCRSGALVSKVAHLEEILYAQDVAAQNGWLDLPDPERLSPP